MSVGENPKNFIFYVIQFKETFHESELKFYMDGKEIKTENYECERKKNNIKNNIISKIYYFQRISQEGKVKITYKNKEDEQKLIENFLYDQKLLSYSQIELSYYEKFILYKEFIIKINSPKLKQMLYENSMTLFTKKSMDFLLIMDLLEYYSNNEQKRGVIFSLVNTQNFFEINYNELNLKRDLYLKIIEYYQPEKYDISKINQSHPNEYGQLIVMLYLYICLDFDKFEIYYNKHKFDKKKKKIIYYIITHNKTTEYLFIIQKTLKDFTNTKNHDKLKNMLIQCNYFENFIFLLDYYTKNSNKGILQSEIKDSYSITPQDDLVKIISNYEEIVSSLPNLQKNEKIIGIWNKYRNLFEKNKKMKSLIELKSVLRTSSIIISINNCLKKCLTSVYYTNMEICEFIKINLVSKISSLKGTINYIDLFKHFD